MTPMTSPLGSDLLTLLLPDLDFGHPVAKHAVKVLPELSGLAREGVVTALLDGPYARGSWAGVLPKELVDAVAGEATEAAERHTGWVHERVQSHVLDALNRHRNAKDDQVTVSTRFADSAWATR